MEVVGAQPREVEQVRHQPLESLRLGLDRLASRDRDVAGGNAVTESLGVATDRGEGGAELVADGQQELALPAFTGGERLGQAVQRAGELRHLGRPVLRQSHVPVAGCEPVRPIGGADQRPRQPAGDRYTEQRGGDQPQQQGQREPAQDRRRHRPRVRGALEQYDAAVVPNRLDFDEVPRAPETAYDGQLLTGPGRCAVGAVEPSRAQGRTVGMDPGDQDAAGPQDPVRRPAGAQRVRCDGPGLRNEDGLSVQDGTCLPVVGVPSQAETGYRRGQHGDRGGQTGGAGDLARHAGPAAHRPGTVAAYPTPRTVLITSAASPSLARSWAMCTSTVRVPAAAA